MARVGTVMDNVHVSIITVSTCAFCSAMHQRRSETCSPSCNRSWKRKGLQPRDDIAERLERGLTAAAAYGAHIHDLAGAIVALEDLRDMLPDARESELLELFAALPPDHQDVLIVGLRRAVAKLLDEAPLSAAAE